MEFSHSFHLIGIITAIDLDVGLDRKNLGFG